MRSSLLRLLALSTLLASAGPILRADDLGLFTDHTDIGVVKKPGTVRYDPARRSYTIGGGGANMWFAQDEFHFVWKKVSGDTALAATIAFTGSGTDAHRKAVLMIRESLATDAAYVDAALHADGLTSLQFRETAGANTAEVQAPLNGPRRLRLEKIGDWAYLFAGPADGPLTPTGASVRLPLSGEYYLGLGVCAHDADEFETITFTDVEIAKPSGAATAIRSILEILPNPSGDRRALYPATEHIEAIAWTAPNVIVVQTRAGRFRLPLAPLADGKLAPAGAPTPDASRLTSLPADAQRVPSPDGKWIAYLRHQPPAK